MTIPNWVIKHKQKGTEIRNIKGNYYLYKISSKWDKIKKRPQKITEKFLGKITMEGLMPPKHERTIKSIAIKEFGASHLIYQMNQDIVADLKELFPYEWKEIFILSLFRLLNQSPIKNIALLYNDSFIQDIIEKARLSSNSITPLLKEIGTNREKIVSFFKKNIVGNEHLLFDVTNIISNSKKLSINHFGYNSANNYDPQINLMYMFSLDRKLPLYYRNLPGNIRETKAFKLCLQESGTKNGVVIADKGFYSEKNIEQLEKENLNYIIPLRRNSKLINYEKIKSGDKYNLDGYFVFENKIVWYYINEENDKKVIIFLDNNLKSQEEKDYILRIENNYEGYNKEEFFKKQFSLGTYAVITNLKNDPEKIYQYIKGRNHIEIMFDAFKNLLQADKTYMRNEKSLEAWMFINHLALIYYYKLYQLLVDKELLNKYSPKDILLNFSQIRKIKIDNEWITSEINTKVEKLVNELNIAIT